MPKVIQVILADELRGQGVESDPFRRVVQVFTLEGELIAEEDPCRPFGIRKESPDAP